MKKTCRTCQKNLESTEFYDRFSICKPCLSQDRKKKYKNYPLKQMLGTIRNKCLKNGIPFNLTEKDIIIPNFCPVLGVKLETAGETQSNSPSIDRIIPEKGYIVGNVVCMSKKANQIKSNGTPDEIYKVYKYLEKLYKKLDIPPK